MDFDEKTLILGIGAQKTGTTWLYSYLNRRRDVFMSPQKELQYFNVKYRPELSGAVEKRFKKRVRRLKRRSKANRSARKTKKLRGLRARLKFRGNNTAYKDYFRSVVPEDINYYGEITPSYALVTEEGFREMRQLFPRARLVFIMRDPVERFYSQIRHILRNKPAHDHEQMIRDHLHDPQFLERSFYQNTVRNIENVFETDEIAYLFYETMFAEDAIRELCAKIGIEYRRPKFKRVVFPTGPRQEISHELYGELKDIFAPTYAFCEQRFGERLPKSWGHRSAKISRAAIVEPSED